VTAGVVADRPSPSQINFKNRPRVCRVLEFLFGDCE
jgi:hypothetical protein